MEHLEAILNAGANNNNNNNNVNNQVPNPQYQQLQQELAQQFNLPLDPYGHVNFASAFGIHQRLGRLFEIAAPEAMYLTPLETHRAITIKDAVEEDERLENLSDFDYVVFAITTPELSMPEVLEKIFHLQALRREYNILETIQDGIAALAKFARQHPNTWLGMEYLPTEGNIMTIRDWSTFNPSTIVTPEDYETFVRAEFYRLRASGPTFQSIREGFVSVIDCTNVTTRNVSFSHDFERIIHEVHNCGLEKYATIDFLNAPMIVNIAITMWKKLVRTNQSQAARLGVQCPGLEGESIAPMFLTPTPEIAQQRALKSAELFLIVRDHNVRNFRLPE